jgi:hypothetical protein
MKSGSSMVLDPSHFSIIETLRNGRRVEIRAQRPQDREDLEAAIARMSDESLYRRFFGARRHFSEKEAEYFLNINFVDRVALVVVAEENGKQSIVGAGRYVVIQPGRAEGLRRRRRIPGTGRRGCPYAQSRSHCASSRFERTDRRSLGQQRRHAQSIREERPPHEHEA